MVTHSDALIREAVGKVGFNVFHMLPCTTKDATENQLRPLTVSKDLERVLADLVGDLAAYRPGGKGLLFEGGGDSDFDKTMTGQLFQDELRGVNLISGSNKARVRNLHEILDRAYSRGDLPTKFYAITDSDGELDASRAITRHQWDVYHIENYLLDCEAIREVLSALNPNRVFETSWVRAKLETSARAVISSQVAHQLRGFVNSQLLNSIDLGFSPEEKQIAQALSSAAARSAERISKALKAALTTEVLAERETAITSELESSFLDDTWMYKLPGREILHRFVNLAQVPIGYEALRNLILSKMVESGTKPKGMAAVIDAIVKD